MVPPPSGSSTTATPDGGNPLIGVIRGIDNTITDADDAFLDMLGLDRTTFDQMLSEGRSLSPPEAVDLDLAALRLAAADGTAAPYHKHFWHSDGHLVPVLVSIWATDEGSRQWIAYAVDLSAAPRKPLGASDRVVSALVGEHDRIASMLDSTSALIWAVDRDLRLVGSNDSFQRAQHVRTGRALHVGDPVLDPAFHVDARANWHAWYRRALDGERFHQRLEADDRRVLDLRFSPMLDVDDTIVGAAVVGTDVTIEHRAAAELDQRESLLRIAGRLGKVAAWTLDRRTMRVTLSDEMVQLLDLPDQHTVEYEQSVEFYPTDRRAEMRSMVERCLTDGIPFDVEAPATTPSRRQLWVRVMGEPHRDEHGEVIGLQGAVADLTERRTSQLKLREQAGLLDNATDAILVRDLDGYVTSWNKAAEALYGWTSSEAVGRHIADLVDGGDMDRYLAMDDILWSDGEWSGRLDNVDRHGRVVVIELHVDVIRDDTGTPIAVFSIASDVTERVHLEERLALSQKLESVGQLTGGLAHDFNNLLTVILGSSEMIAESAADDTELSSLAELITSAAERGAELTMRLLAFARRQPLRPQVVDPREVTAEVIALLQRSLPESITIAVETDDQACHVSIDPGQLEAALMNLALNARDSMPQGGRLTFSIDTTVLAREPQLGVTGGRYARIVVADTGSGIPHEIRERVFDPFFTTKDPGKGTGLGLSMVYGFIRQSGGHVDLRSDPGTGTAIELLLPLADSAAGARPLEPRPTDELPGGTERVLVVEDEPLVRRQTISVLTSLGYAVIEAGDAAEAREQVADADGLPQVDLVFSDIVMPGGTNGFELAAELRERFPALTILLTSGYADDADGGQRDHDLPLLQKPYRRGDLARAVRRSLDGDPSTV